MYWKFTDRQPNNIYHWGSSWFSSSQSLRAATPRLLYIEFLKISIKLIRILFKNNKQTLCDTLQMTAEVEGIRNLHTFWRSSRAAPFNLDTKTHKRNDKERIYDGKSCHRHKERARISSVDFTVREGLIQFTQLIQSDTNRMEIQRQSGHDSNKIAETTKMRQNKTNDNKTKRS